MTARRAALQTQSSQPSYSWCYLDFPRSSPAPSHICDTQLKWPLQIFFLIARLHVCVFALPFSNNVQGWASCLSVPLVDVAIITVRAETDQQNKSTKPWNLQAAIPWSSNVVVSENIGLWFCLNGKTLRVISFSRPELTVPLHCQFKLPKYLFNMVHYLMQIALTSKQLNQSENYVIY